MHCQNPEYIGKDVKGNGHVPVSDTVATSA